MPPESATIARVETAATRRSRQARRRRSVGHKVGTYVGLSVASLIVLFPLYILVADSLFTNSQLFSSPPVLLPTHPAWGNFSSAFTTYDFGLYLRNSSIQTSIIVVAQLVTSVLAAYAFVFVKFPLRRTFFMLVLGTIMIPFEVTVAVNYATVQDLNWNNSFLGLVAPFLATGFGIFLIRQAFLQIPRELKEAAVIDGYGHLRFLWRVAIPLARPVIAALAVFSFLGAWNQYLWPALLTPGNPSIQTVQPGLATISGSAATFGVDLAATIMAIAPLLILLIFFRKNLIRSLTAGAVK